jgi:hypothetical protein
LAIEFDVGELNSPGNGHLLRAEIAFGGLFERRERFDLRQKRNLEAGEEKKGDGARTNHFDKAFLTKIQSRARDWLGSGLARTAQTTAKKNSNVHL